MIDQLSAAHLYDNQAKAFDAAADVEDCPIKRGIFRSKANEFRMRAGEWREAHALIDEREAAQ